EWNGEADATARPPAVAARSGGCMKLNMSPWRKVASLLAVTVLGLVGAVAVASPALALPTCSSKTGTYLQIGQCGGNNPNVSVEFINGASPVGHLEIWDYWDPQYYYHNGPNKAYGNHETAFFSNEDWIDVGARTCVEFWVQSGGTWVRWHGE